MPLHVYGVVRSARPDPSSVDGVGTPPGHIGLVRSGELAAAVSTIEPDFEPRDLYLAVANFQQRDRRFGRV